MKDSKIEWTHHTFNPWIGCTKVSPACDHCYAEVSTAARSTAARIGAPLWGPRARRHRTSAQYWQQPLRWNREAEAAGTRPRVFCASLADVFDNAVPEPWRWDLFRLIRATPQLDWLLLTKRIGNAAKMMDAAAAAALDDFAGAPTWAREPWPNVWLGATVVCQDEANRDVPKLLATPARLRFLSIEPMLGPVTVFDMDGPVDLPNGMASPLHWIICGGESGPYARPIHPAWVRSLRDQCTAAGVPFLHKQWGEWWPISQMPDGWLDPEENQRFRSRWTVLQLDGTQEEAWPPGAMTCFRVGKKIAGRILDGRTHDSFPGVA